MKQNKLDSNTRGLICMFVFFMGYAVIGIIGVSPSESVREVLYTPMAQMDTLTDKTPYIVKYEVTEVSEENTTESTTEIITTSEDELYMLAHIIYAEAGNCSYECQLYVGSVVLNRINSPYYPDNMYDVLHQSGQYGPIWNGSYNKEPNEMTWDIAAELLANGSALPPDVLGQTGTPGANGTYAVIDGVYFNYR